MHLKKFIKDLLTEADNDTYDLTRVLSLGGGLVIIVCQCIATYQSGIFDANNFGIGFSAYMAGCGLGIGFKSKLEGPATHNNKKEVNDDHS